VDGARGTPLIRVVPAEVSLKVKVPVGTTLGLKEETVPVNK
jgi:hypothetical protein